MKKTLKFIGMVFALILLIYTLFVVEESFRLSTDVLAEPLIILNESHVDGDVIYKSLGFTFKVEYANLLNSNDMVYPISQEFWLFDIFLIWGWIS